MRRVDNVQEVKRYGSYSRVSRQGAVVLEFRHWQMPAWLRYGESEMEVLNEVERRVGRVAPSEVRQAVDLTRMGSGGVEVFAVDGGWSRGNKDDQYIAPKSIVPRDSSAIGRQYSPLAIGVHERRTIYGNREAHTG